MENTLDSRKVRQAYIDFFIREGHAHIPSSSLIPQGDPTLLFVNAGMVQFKDVFLGMEKRNYSRATSYQRCMRVSGKHNDLENVGYTARHHTLFEMLGNFSFGDYFKTEAIDFAWRFVVDELGIPLSKLYFTVFREDSEAENLWIRRGASRDRVLRFDEKDNFWAMGDTGPCGPNSEILFDQGADVGCGKPGCAPGCSCDRFLEIWNLVFMQFDRDREGKLNPLSKPGVDTGMGLERTVAIMQGKKSNYDSDLFVPIIEAAARAAGKEYGRDSRDDVAMRVIADHIRACSFLVADGVMPANTGAGYVLRKILRRAARYGDMLGIEGTFLYGLVPSVTDNLGCAYDYLPKKADHISRVIRMEEERFGATLTQGRALMDEIICRCRNTGVINGPDAFKLYDTYGFPLDLTRDIAKRAGLAVDVEGYEKEMTLQRERAQAASKFGLAGEESLSIGTDKNTCFRGYDQLVSESTVLYAEGNVLALDETPFYAESGGQVSDTGAITGPDGITVRVTEVRKNPQGQIVHILESSAGWKQGDRVSCKVDMERRAAVQRNHTATHLLHAALRQVLGDHVVQAGSLVAPDRLRFDFKHYTGLKADELHRIEAAVNRAVLCNTQVSWKETDMGEARNMGAMMLFGEKYGERVRVVDVAGVSRELCGGCHVHHTGEIGLFKIMSETAVAANVRRVEAATGMEALNWVNTRLEAVDKTSAELRCTASEIPARVEKLMAEKKELAREINDLKLKLASGNASGAAVEAQDVNGIKYLSRKMDGLSVSQLRTAADEMAAGMKTGVVVLGTAEPKVLFITKVTDDLVSRGIHAGNIVKKIAEAAGGGGGGRADFAQAGGSRPESIDDAFRAGAEALRQMASGS